jgi:magnesium transporter
MHDPNKILYADDDKESISLLLRLRLPPLALGLILGICISLLTSRFEEVIKANVHVAFFIPFVVYIADATGTQTQAIYTRDLKTHRSRFHIYFAKELLLGIVSGAIFGMIIFAATLAWLHNLLLAFAIGISTFVAVATAPTIALITTEISNKLRKDPAVESGPIATVIQDATSILIYGAITSLMLL